MAVGQRVPKGDVEAEFVADLPDQTDQPRDGLFLSEYPLVKDFRNRPHLPFRWAFDDAADENIGVMVSRQRSLSIEVNRSPIRTLRDNSRPAHANTAVAGAVRQQHTEFGRDARSALVLKAPGHHDML